jgi:hypothetical protein
LTLREDVCRGESLVSEPGQGQPRTRAELGAEPAKCPHVASSSGRVVYLPSQEEAKKGE